MFKTYNASAGSGKTTSLVIEYLSLCFLNISRYKQILAITFTNNATAEMKERIIRCLNLFAYTPADKFPNSGDKNIYDKIIERCCLKLPELKDSNAAETFMTEKSQQLLESILYDYSNLSISTIDSFFQRILRSFAFELHLNMNFNLEITLDDLYTQAIDLLLNKISENNPGLTQRIMSLTDHQLDNSGRWKIEKNLREILSEYIYKEQNYEALKNLNNINRNDFIESCQSFKKLVNKQLSDTRTNAMQAANRGHELISGLGDANIFYRGKQGIYPWFEKVTQSFPTISINSYIETGIQEGSFTKKHGEDANSYDEICTLIDTIIKNGNEYLKYKKLGEQLDSLMILFDLKDIMDEIKQRDNLFYLSETNAKIYEEIKDEEAPYIYEKIGNKYSYFFIDEFQDTSRMQWDNLLPLIRNALASNGETTIFGDLKQAIYRFRGGDANLFATLSDANAFEKQAIHARSFELVSLDTNYRSARHIIEFNNGCFKLLENEIPFYNETQKIDNHNNLTGFVSIHFKPKEESVDDYLNKNTLAMVKDALNRGFKYCDIAILTRSTIKSSELAQLLSSEGHPVISEDSLKLSASNEITLIINTLQFLSNPQDTLAQYGILSYLRQRQKSVTPIGEEISTITNLNNSSFLKLLSETYGVHIKPQTLASLPLFTLVKELVNIFQLTSYDAYLIRFMDLLLEFGKQHDENITQFLNWWETKRHSVSVVSSRDDDAITITTIHKAKGLGFPVVIIPLNMYNARMQGTLWYQPSDKECTLPYLPIKIGQDMENINCLQELYQEEKNAHYIDNCNILYVAQTRAREALYIITGEKTKGNYSKLISQYLNNLSAENLIEINENEYIYGDRDYKHLQQKKETDQKLKISKLYTNGFTPSQLLPPEAPLNEQQKQGIAVHNYLASLTQFPQDEKDLDNMVIDLDEQYRPAVRNILRRIISNEQLKPYFQPNVKVLNEITITDKEGHAYRPDRIVITNNEVMVIDYKTGQKQERYQQQLEGYIILLQEMGYSNVHGQLIYID